MMKNYKAPSMNRFISIIHRKFQVFLNKELEETGINSSEFLYIITLYKSGEMSLTDLSSYLKVDNAQSTRSINRLLKMGLVKKIRNESDKRGFKISLSEKGNETIPLIKNALDKWNSIINQGLDDEEIKYLTKKLEYIAKNALEAVKLEE